MVDLLACPFCGDDGEKGRQTVTQMNEARTTFDRILCRCCGAMAPELNWQSRAAIQKAAGAVPEGWRLVPINPTEKMLRAWLGEPVRTPAHEVDEYSEIRDLAYSYRAMLAAATLPPAVPQKNPDHLDSGVGGGVQVPKYDPHMRFLENEKGTLDLRIEGLSMRQIKDIFEQEYDALMWSEGCAYPCDKVKLQFIRADFTPAAPTGEGA